MSTGRRHIESVFIHQWYQLASFRHTELYSQRRPAPLHLFRHLLSDNPHRSLSSGVPECDHYAKCDHQTTTVSLSVTSTANIVPETSATSLMKSSGSPSTTLTIKSPSASVASAAHRGLRIHDDRSPNNCNCTGRNVVLQTGTIRNPCKSLTNLGEFDALARRALDSTAALLIHSAHVSVVLAFFGPFQ